MIQIENQLSPRWKKCYIGKVKTSSFANFACFLFCLTYLYSLKLGRQISPLVVDKMFVDAGVYNGDMINSGKAAKVLGLHYFGIENDINNPPYWNPSIKQVDYSLVNGKQTHFVVRTLVGGKQMILDPIGGVQRAVNYYEKKVNEISWEKKGFSYRLFEL